MFVTCMFLYLCGLFAPFYACPSMRCVTTGVSLVWNVLGTELLKCIFRSVGYKLILKWSSGWSFAKRVRDAGSIIHARSSSKLNMFIIGYSLYQAVTHVCILFSDFTGMNRVSTMTDKLKSAPQENKYATNSRGNECSAWVQS